MVVFLKAKLYVCRENGTHFVGSYEMYMTSSRCIWPKSGKFPRRAHVEGKKPFPERFGVFVALMVSTYTQISVEGYYIHFNICILICVDFLLE